MGYPKALLGYRGATFLDTLIDLFASRCSTVTVVLGARADQIRRGVIRQAAFVLNPEWPHGQLSSMQCGLRAVPPDADGVLFTLVDHPAVAPATMDALLGDGPQTLLRVPRYEGRRGHPIWLSRALIPEFLALPAAGAARDVVRRHAADTVCIDLNDPGIVADIDDPAAYLSLIGESQ